RRAGLGERSRWGLPPGVFIPRLCGDARFVQESYGRLSILRRSRKSTGHRHAGRHLHRTHPRFLRALGRSDPLLRNAEREGGQAMNWIYWLSGIAALLVFVYLLIALFKPEYFE